MALSPRKMLAAVAVLALLGDVLANPTTPSSVSQDIITLQILHNNDIHANYEETCSKKKCYGGMARIATVVEEARNSSVPTIFLNAGDTFLGTIWHSVHREKAAVKFLNAVKPDVVTLGNHDFDEGVNATVRFINDVTFPVVCANLNLTNQPDFINSSKLLNYTILEKGGLKIGVVGYLTPSSTQYTSNVENVTILDEIPVLQKISKELKEKEKKVDFVIALGHSGYDIDMKIAEKVENVDIVVGGHTNTFLYNGRAPGSEKVEGPYPTVVKQASGKNVYIVQASKHTKYLGNLTVTFDTKKKIIKEAVGNPIYLSEKIKQAENVLDIIKELTPEVEAMKNKTVGKTRVFLGGKEFCKLSECNLGNLITDAMIEHYALKYNNTNGWTDASIAVINSGSMRGSVSKENNGTITMADVMTVLPFENMIYKVDITGKEIRSMLEHGVSKHTPSSDDNSVSGSLLQVSGLQVKYNFSMPTNSKVLSVYARCASCRVPNYEELNDTATYQVLMNEFIYKGGDGYTMLEKLGGVSNDVSLMDVLLEYLKKHSPVYPDVEWRITFDNSTTTTTTPGGKGGANVYQPVTAILLLPLVIWALLS